MSKNIKCYKIDDKVFLKGNFNEDAQSDEYFDMTTEMETGHSYSQFIKDESTLTPATEEETEKVALYLSKL